MLSQTNRRLASRPTCGMSRMMLILGEKRKKYKTRGMSLNTYCFILQFLKYIMIEHHIPGSQIIMCFPTVVLKTSLLCLHCPANLSPAATDTGRSHIV